MASEDGLEPPCMRTAIELPVAQQHVTGLGFSYAHNRRPGTGSHGHAQCEVAFLRAAWPEQNRWPRVIHVRSQEISRSGRVKFQQGFRWKTFFHDF